MKPSSVGDPDIYLGAKLKQVKLPNGLMAWGMSPSIYVQQAVKNCQTHLTEKLNGTYQIPSRANNLFPMDYCADTDTLEPLTPENASFFMHLIGVMRWMMEIGRIDIATEVSILSSYLAFPPEGHLETALHIMGYLQQKHNTELVFDPTYPKIIYSDFLKQDWTKFYGEVKEAIPAKMPEPLGKYVDLRMMVDADHAGDKTNRRSQTGFFIFCNMLFIDWLSKKQPTIKTSIFGSEFAAMKHGIKKLWGLRYKCRMMGMPLSGPLYVYGDNNSCITNSTQPE